MAVILINGLRSGHYGFALMSAIFWLYYTLTGVARYVVLRGLEWRFLDPQRGHVFEKTVFLSVGFTMVFSFTSRFWLNLGSNYGLDVNGALATFLSHGGWNTVSHLSYLFFPTIVLRNSMLGPREKVGVTAVFGVGILYDSLSPYHTLSDQN
ncbi:hypothetical protein ANO14919_111610 [Xylariales sp. No.14919]|nr:hypothetical protein ANO14919_111610 [Xylariales sp. No.14919]